jgi:hypothetical protein
VFPYNTGDSAACKAWKLAATICNTTPVQVNTGSKADWTCPVSGGFTDPTFGTYCPVTTQRVCSDCTGLCNAVCTYTPLSIVGCDGKETAQPGAAPPPPPVSPQTISNISAPAVCTWVSDSMQGASFVDVKGPATRTLTNTGSTTGDLLYFNGVTSSVTLAGVTVPSTQATFTARLAPEVDAAARTAYTINYNGAPKLQVRVQNGAFTLAAV